MQQITLEIRDKFELFEDLKEKCEIKHKQFQMKTKYHNIIRLLHNDYD